MKEVNFMVGGCFTADELINAIIDSFDVGVPKNAKMEVNGYDKFIIEYDQKENVLRLT